MFKRSAVIDGALLRAVRCRVAPGRRGGRRHGARRHRQHRQDGYSIGINTNSDSEAQARDAALKYCRSHGSDAARAKCEIFGIFRDQCAAEAEDPQSGTPGAGWAIAADKAAAEKMAMMNCLATAGDRGSFCKVVTSVCDGNGDIGTAVPGIRPNGGKQ